MADSVEPTFMQDMHFMATAGTGDCRFGNTTKPCSKFMKKQVTLLWHCKLGGGGDSKRVYAFQNDLFVAIAGRQAALAWARGYLLSVIEYN